jgi:hypothetical protein
MCSPSQGYYQGQHNTPSPKIKAVVEAFRLNFPDETPNQDLKCLANAIRAIAKHYAWEDFNTMLLTAEQLKDIADELDEYHE